MSGAGRSHRKAGSMKTTAQDSADPSPAAIPHTAIPRVPLTRKSKLREPLALVRRKVLSHSQEVQEPRIQGNGEVSLLGRDFPSVPHLSPGSDARQDEDLCTRFQGNEVATQTRPIYCFSSVEDIVEFLNRSRQTDVCSPNSFPLTDEPLEEDTAYSDDHVSTLRLEIEEDDDDDQPVVSHLYPTHPFHFVSSCSPSFPAVKRRRKQRFHCDWQGPVTIISSPSVPTHAIELRVDEDLAVSIRRQVDINNPGPFGWQLAKLLFTEEELYGHNFNGTDQKMPLSPRRVHAIQHAFHDYFPRDIADEALARGRTAINQGIRNMFYVRSRRDGEAP